MWPSCDHHVIIMWPSCDIHMTFICPIMCLIMWSSCDHHVIIMWPCGCYCFIIVLISKWTHWLVLVRLTFSQLTINPILFAGLKPLIVLCRWILPLLSYRSQGELYYIQDSYIHTNSIIVLIVLILFSQWLKLSWVLWQPVGMIVFLSITVNYGQS